MIITNHKVSYKYKYVIVYFFFKFLIARDFEDCKSL